MKIIKDTAVIISDFYFYNVFYASNYKNLLGLVFNRFIFLSSIKSIKFFLNLIFRVMIYNIF